MMAMIVAPGLDFLSTWIVAPRMEAEANPLMRRADLVRMALLILPGLSSRKSEFRFGANLFI
jgi:hypothetical protein